MMLLNDEMREAEVERESRLGEEQQVTSWFTLFFQLHYLEKGTGDCSEEEERNFVMPFGHWSPSSSTLPQAGGRRVS